jgi:hypothetical protein
MQCCLLLHTAWLVALFISDIQSDLIGRIFGYWATVFIGQFFLTFTSSPKFKGAFCKVKSFALIPSKNLYWATIWEIVPQTHLVALAISTDKKNWVFKWCW